MKPKNIQIKKNHFEASILCLQEASHIFVVNGCLWHKSQYSVLSKVRLPPIVPGKLLTQAKSPDEESPRCRKCRVSKYKVGSAPA